MSSNVHDYEHQVNDNIQLSMSPNVDSASYSDFSLVSDQQRGASTFRGKPAARRTPNHDEVEPDSQVGEYQIHPVITKSKWSGFTENRVSHCTDIWKQFFCSLSPPSAIKHQVAACIFDKCQDDGGQ